MMKARFIDTFAVILLDMGNTFMFECDRFGPEVDYYSTYRDFGGTTLGSETISRFINALFNHLVAIGRIPAYYDNFGSVRSYLEKLSKSAELPDTELNILENVFAQHEVGVIPDSHVEIIQHLSRSHPLGIISNIWAHRSVFEDALRHCGIFDLFDVVVWSSDYSCIKPSPQLFRRALAHFSVEPTHVLFVGDNLIGDIGGARAMGMPTVWINSEEGRLSEEDPQPDLIISDLGDLLTEL